MDRKEKWHTTSECAVTGAKIPKASQAVGQPCPFCGGTQGAPVRAVGSVESGTSSAELLQNLQRLHDDGLIGNDEYQERRQQVLDDALAGERQKTAPSTAPTGLPTPAETVWSRRKRWQKVGLVGGGVVGALVVFASLGGGGIVPAEEVAFVAATAPSAEPSEDAFSAEPNEDALSAEPNPAADLPTAPTTEAAPSIVPTTLVLLALDFAYAGIGDPVRDGNFEFVVDSVGMAGKVYSPGGILQDEANGVWFVAEVRVTNIGDGAQTFFAGNQKIIWEDRELEADGFTWNGTNVEELNPGVSLDAVLLFDVPLSFPADGAGTTMRLHDSAFSRGIEVQL